MGAIRSGSEQASDFVNGLWVLACLPPPLAAIGQHRKGSLDVSGEVMCIATVSNRESHLTPKPNAARDSGMIRIATAGRESHFRQPAYIQKNKRGLNVCFVFTKPQSRGGRTRMVNGHSKQGGVGFFQRASRVRGNDKLTEQCTDSRL